MDTTTSNTQTRDQQIATTKAVDAFGPTVGLGTTSSSVPTTIPGPDIISNPQSFQVPQISDPNSALTNAITGINASVSNAQNVDKTAEDKNNSSNDTLVNLMQQLGNQTSDTNTAETSVGLPTMNKDLSDLKTLQTQQLGGYLSAINKNDVNAEGHFGPAVSDDEAKITRQHGIDALLTSSLIQAKEGNITAAQATVDRAIAAKYDPIKNAINVQNTIIAQNSANLSRADKKLADEKVTQNNLMLKQIDKQAADEKDIQDTIQLVASHGAPNSIVALMTKAKSPLEAMQIGRAYIPDTLARTLQSLQIKKLNQEISNSDLTSKVYVAGANPAVDAIVQNINSGKSKLGDIPASQAGLKNLVQQGLAVTNGDTSDILTTTQQSIQELNDMVDKNHGFTSAVGVNVPNPLGVFTDPLDQIGFKNISGTQSADFTAKLNQVKNDVVLPNLKLLKGVGRITEKEFTALNDAITALSPSLSEGQFKKELATLTTGIDTQVAAKQKASSVTPSSNAVIIPKGTDGTSYGFPGYVSDGNTWVLK